jgi:mono/diheme cytochrome c family protein
MIRIAAPVLFVAAVGLFSCSSPQKTQGAAAPAAPEAVMVAAPVPKSLKAAMQGIEEDARLLGDAFGAGELPELGAAAAAAGRIADVMRFAYELWEDKEVPDFAKYARESEAAFLQMSKDAAAGRADAVRELGKTLMDQHCARCHDAVEEAKG